MLVRLSSKDYILESNSYHCALTLTVYVTSSSVSCEFSFCRSLIALMGYSYDDCRSLMTAQESHQSSIRFYVIILCFVS